MANKRKSGSIAATISIVLVLILITGFVGWATNGFTGSGKFGDWFGKKEEQKQEASPPVDENGTAMVPGQVHELPRNLVFRTSALLSAPSASTINLTATIEPANATNQSVNWQAAWVNENSAWATGKKVEDYVTITVSESNTKTAAVACLAPFGEKIKIVVKSLDNENATAECQVDYLQRVTATKVTIGASSSISGDTATILSASAKPELKFAPESTSGTGKKAVTVAYTNSVYTKADTVTTTVKIKPTDEFKTVASTTKYVTGVACNEVDITSGYVPDKNFLKSLFSAAVTDNATNYSSLRALLAARDWSVYLGMSAYMPTTGMPSVDQMQYIQDHIKPAYDAYAAVGTYKITVTTTTSFGAKTDTYYAWTDASTVAVRVSNVSLGQTELIF